MGWFKRLFGNADDDLNALINKAWDSIDGECDVNPSQAFEQGVRFAFDEINRLTEDNEELNQLFDLQRKRMQEADKRWQEATGKHDVWPDLGDLLDWLMENMDNWKDAFYKEERRAIEYHNSDQVDGGFKCGHPVSCIRNKKDGTGVHCVMCTAIKESRKEAVEEAADND